MKCCSLNSLFSRWLYIDPLGAIHSKLTSRLMFSHFSHLCHLLTHKAIYSTLQFEGLVYTRRSAIFIPLSFSTMKLKKSLEEQVLWAFYRMSPFYFIQSASYEKLNFASIILKLK
jgi:hypothetical protein